MNVHYVNMNLMNHYNDCNRSNIIVCSYLQKLDLY